MPTSLSLSMVVIKALVVRVLLFALTGTIVCVIKVVDILFMYLDGFCNEPEFRC
jgi:hypothetical protein